MGQTYRGRPVREIVREHAECEERDTALRVQVDAFVTSILDALPERPMVHREPTLTRIYDTARAMKNYLEATSP